MSAINPVFGNTEYESASLSPSSKQEEVDNSTGLPLPHGEVIAYEYSPQSSADDEYDYECPYWAPADMRSELLSQFRKLRMPSVAQKELE